MLFRLCCIKVPISIKDIVKLYVLTNMKNIKEQKFSYFIPYQRKKHAKISYNSSNIILFIINLNIANMIYITKMIQSLLTTIDAR